MIINEHLGLNTVVSTNRQRAAKNSRISSVNRPQQVIKHPDRIILGAHQRVYTKKQLEQESKMCSRLPLFWFARVFRQ